MGLRCGGTGPGGGESLRYVLLHHTDCPVPHFDLMLEQDADGPLLTWRLPNWPVVAGDTFTPIAAHRRAYLVYEGPLSLGRGRVDRVAAGRYEWSPADGRCRCVRLAPSGVILSLPVSGSLPESERE